MSPHNAEAADQIATAVVFVLLSASAAVVAFFIPREEWVAFLRPGLPPVELPPVPEVPKEPTSRRHVEGEGVWELMRRIHGPEVSQEIRQAAADSRGDRTRTNRWGIMPARDLIERLRAEAKEGERECSVEAT